MTGWRCRSCDTPNTMSAPRCRRCLRWANRPPTLGDLINRALRDFDRHQAALRKCGLKKKKGKKK